MALGEEGEGGNVFLETSPKGGDGEFERKTGINREN